ncbi:MAG: ribulose-phosphate 3-epimerase [Planctomycetota bacterium]
MPSHASQPATSRPITNVLTNPPQLPLIAPSILAADYTKLGEECRSAIEAGGDLLHFDVMDGHLVPNLALGVDMLASLKAAMPDAFFDAHLMIERPDVFAEPFAQAGAEHLTFHIEAMNGEMAGDRGRALIDTIRGLGMSAGIAIDGPTAIEKADALLEHADLVLIMAIRAGFSGQAFAPAALDKIRYVRERVSETTRIEVDGGVGPANAADLLQAGADVLAAASAVFRVSPPERVSVITQMRGSASGS